MKRRLRALFSWSAAGPILAYLASAIIVVSVVGAFVAAHDATDARNRTATAASRRIDKLQTEINNLETQLRNLASHSANQRGRLEDAIRALAAQIRQMGGQPVTDGQSPQPSPSPSHSASPRPTSMPSPSSSPQPSHSPQPSPSPSSLLCRIAKLCP